MKSLYKKDSKGKIRIWTVSTIDDKLQQQSGIFEGNLVVHSKICTSKNIGKTNEITGSEQALLELESLYKSKLDEGYFKTIKEADTVEVILPMLAKSYEDYKDKIDWDICYIQPKLDGMRCLAIVKDGNITLISRDGKSIENMNHIIDELVNIRGNVILDGELYSHGNTFQENMKLIKKYRPGLTENIKYHVYDHISGLEFNKRNAKLKTCIDENQNIVFVETYKITSENQLKTFHSQFIEMGYEGSIIRHGNKSYGINKRCDSLLKYKDFQDIALVIEDITPNESNPNHGTPNFTLNGKQFKAGVKMSHDDRHDLLINRENYIGKTAEIRYFEMTDGGIPRFPVMIGIRLDK
jgi:DNA ligase-1